jgi:hypothetical protein
MFLGITVLCPLSAVARTYIFKASKSGISTIFVIPYEIVTLMNANNPEFKSTELTEETIRIFYRVYNMSFWKRVMRMQRG